MRGFFMLRESTVRQRNPGPYSLSVPSLSAVVHPGEIVEHDDPICGFEPVDADEPPTTTTSDGEPDPPAAADPAPASKPRSRKPTPTTDPAPAGTEEA